MTGVSWGIKNGKFAVWQAYAGDNDLDAVVNPLDHLANIYCHSDFDYYVVAAQVDASVTFAAVSSGTYSMGSVSITGKVTRTQQVLYAHNLGYAPKYKVADGSKLVQNGYPTQTGSNEVRTVSFSADATNIYVTDVGIAGSSTLASVSRTFSLLLFKQVTSDPALPLFSGPQAMLAHGRIRATERHLHNSDGVTDASPFDLNLGVAMDIENGAVKWWNPDGTTTSFGTYGGSMSAPSNIQCAVE